MYRKIPLGGEHPLGMERPVVELFRVSGRDRGVTTMARHVRTPQLLAAMDGGRWGIWLAPGGPTPLDPTWVEVAPGEAIVLDAGTWHHGPVPLAAEAGAYLTIEAPGTNRDDFEERDVRWATDAGPATG
ncbi:MAG: hypothetical protein Q8P18_30810 [Pseudomonadota bacterium]|nr:hypothetical protein [Pseudomonadota bacterium]